MQATNPQIDHLTHDSYAVVWQQRCYPGVGNRIMLRFFSLFDPDTDPIEVASTTSGNMLLTPDVAGIPDPNMDGRGDDDHVWVTWQQENGNAWAVSCVKTGCGTPIDLGPAYASSEDDAHLSAARFGPQNDMHGAFVWVDEVGSQTRINLVRESFDDGPPVTPIVVSTTGLHKSPSIATFENSYNFVVTWIDDSNGTMNYRVYQGWMGIPLTPAMTACNLNNPGDPNDPFDCAHTVNHLMSSSQRRLGLATMNDGIHQEFRLIYFATVNSVPQIVSRRIDMLNWANPQLMPYTVVDSSQTQLALSSKSWVSADIKWECGHDYISVWGGVADPSNDLVPTTIDAAINQW